jgi:hypothetical protein
MRLRNMLKRWGNSRDTPMGHLGHNWNTPEGTFAVPRGSEVYALMDALFYEGSNRARQKLDVWRARAWNNYSGGEHIDWSVTYGCPHRPRGFCYDHPRMPNALQMWGLKRSGERNFLMGRHSRLRAQVSVTPCGAFDGVVSDQRDVWEETERSYASVHIIRRNLSSAH